MTLNVTPPTRTVRDVLSKLSDDLYFLAGSDEADLRKLVDKSLDYLRVVRAEIRRLDARSAKAEKVIGKPNK